MSAPLSAIIARHADREGPLLPILHDVQAEYGCIDRAAEAAIALALNLSRAEVHGVVSFYHDFRAAPDPRPEVQLCRAEACQARGVEALVPAAERAAGERVRFSAAAIHAASSGTAGSSSSRAVSQARCGSRSATTPSSFTTRQARRASPAPRPAADCRLVGS